MKDALDLIIEQNKLHLFISDPDSHTNNTALELRSSLLSSLYRMRRTDRHAHGLVYKHFNMHIEVGQEFEIKATEALDTYAEQGYSPRDPILLEITEMLIRASVEYSSAQCSLAAARCRNLMALTMQQMLFPEKQWVCLTDSECKDLLPKIYDISTALVLARAYSFHTAQVFKF